MARICYVHAGTHKTGTTYLQTFLALNQESLSREGLYVPVTGRPGPLSGHHNIADALCAGQGCGSADRVLELLEAELLLRAEPYACLSSENFENCSSNLAGLRRLVEMLRRLGYNTKAILYLRPQADYAQSLYAELLRHELNISFREFLESFTSSGEFAFVGRWHYASDYTRLLNAYASELGRENLIVRPYYRREPAWLVTDFMSQTLPNWQLDSARHQLPPGLENSSLPPAPLLRLLMQNIIGCSLPDCCEAAPPLRQEVLDGLPDRFEPLTLTQIARIACTLGNANRKLLIDYHVFIPPVSWHMLRTGLLTSLGLGRDAKKRRRLSVLCGRTPAELLAWADGREITEQ